MTVGAMVLLLTVVSVPFNWAVAVGIWRLYRSLPPAVRPAALRSRGQAQGAVALVWTALAGLYLVSFLGVSPVAPVLLLAGLAALDAPALSFLWYYWRIREPGDGPR